jgi:hypothetical protein
MTATPTKNREQPDAFAEQPGQLSKNQASLPPAHASMAANRNRRALSVSVAYAVAVSILGLGVFALIAPSPLYVEWWDFSPLTRTLTFARHSHRVLTNWAQARSESDVLNRRPALLTARSPCCWHQQR